MFWPFISEKRLEREIAHRLKLQKTAEALLNHVDLYGGFIGENGTCETNGRDPVCIEHWETFHALKREYWNNKFKR